jgi:hypothetical protein
MLSVCLYGSTALWTLAPFSVFESYIQSVRLLGRGIRQSHDRYLHTGQNKQNKSTQTSMPLVGLEPTVPPLLWAKTVLASNRVHCNRRHMH